MCRRNISAPVRLHAVDLRLVKPSFDVDHSMIGSHAIYGFWQRDIHPSTHQDGGITPLFSMFKTSSDIDHITDGTIFYICFVHRSCRQRYFQGKSQHDRLAFRYLAFTQNMRCLLSNVCWVLPDVTVYPILIAQP